MCPTYQNSIMLRIKRHNHKIPSVKASSPLYPTNCYSLTIPPKSLDPSVSSSVKSSSVVIEIEPDDDYPVYSVPTFNTYSLLGN